MIELPESATYARQINDTLTGKTIRTVLAASSPHKFAWYYGEPADYKKRLEDCKFISARGIGMFVEVTLSHATLLFSDGVNLRLHPQAGPIPKKHQLLLELDDGSHLSASIAMYGGVICWGKGDDYDNLYYTIAKEKPSPLADAFNEDYFHQLLAPEEVQKRSLKGALATEQRIPGLGNGCLQDILWNAKLHPKRKTHTLSNEEVSHLYTILKETLTKMTEMGGRNTEKGLLGNPGGYPVVMCAANKDRPCPRCSTPIKKEAYMGGSIYTCETCQPLL
jgi:formamidopyrimidine-DNA glycosylase